MFDITGCKFGRLTVAWFAGIRRKPSGANSYMWLCFCECGEMRILEGSALRKGHPKSCGCIRIGHRPYNFSHLKSRTPEYRSYAAAKNRCNNPNNHNYARYGGRGIKFLFNSFEEFNTELGSRPVGYTLDRINPEGHYEPGNVRWATPKVQAQNKKRQVKWEKYIV